MAGETTAELIFAPRTIWGELHGEVGDAFGDLDLPHF